MSLRDAPRLHLNENLSPRLAIQLRKHGFDVTTSHQVGLLSKSDEEQLEHVALERRALVTFNVRDFAALHAKYMVEGKEHWGIVFSTQETTGVLLRRLLRLLNTLEAEELKNQVRWLNEFK